MNRYKYMRLPLHYIPEDIIAQYNLLVLDLDGWVYLDIRKGMPGLKQAGTIPNNRLTLHLAKNSYAPAPHTPLLWAHAHLPIMLSLVVDNFGVKYTGDASAYHLIATLRSLYTISVDWYVSLFCCLTIVWDYANRTVDVSMPGYINKALHKFQHPHPKRRQDFPHSWTQTAYGTKV